MLNAISHGVVLLWREEGGDFISDRRHQRSQFRIEREPMVIPKPLFRDMTHGPQLFPTKTERLFVEAEGSQSVICFREN